MSSFSSTPTRDPSTDNVDPTRTNPELDLLASAITPRTNSHAERQDTAPKKDDKHTNLEIIVDSDVLTLRGSGAEVTPTLLSGHVVLQLAESTPVKQITLQFRGKAKLPPLGNEPFTNSTMTYIVCNHEWSFLEGEKGRSHTLKAGRHMFPFQLRLGGSLPSLFILAPMAATQEFITLLRSFSRDALEYQQSLEIENTWPEKLMYSIMIPHKAWAAGDDLTAVAKFSPLSKGVRILSVVTTLNETIRTVTRTGWQESTKPVIIAKHEFRNGQAVYVEHQDHRHHTGSSHQAGARNTHSGPATPGGSTPLHTADYSRHHSPSLGNATSFVPTPNLRTSNESPASLNPERGSSTSAQPSLPQAESRSESHSIPLNFELSEVDIVTKIKVSLPVGTTPTHALEPIIASHRIRWSILIGNLDGHTSELRCSLPLHILDYRLLDEAKSATVATRRLLIGGPEVPEEHNPDLELPSYPSHIRDRIAHVSLPDQAIQRVTNPWIQQGINPMLADDSDLDHVSSQLHSLSQNAPPSIEALRDMTSPRESAPSSRSASRRESRAQSRAPSPDRERESHSRRSSGNDSPDPTTSTFVHVNGSTNRNVHGLFHATMKPFTSLSSSFAFPTRHHAQTQPPPPPRPPSNPQSVHQNHQTHPQQQQQQHPHTVPAFTSHSPLFLHRVFTEVPDYAIASRGFLGGITPLETLRGLPSYEEAEMQRSRSESDLASMTRVSRIQDDAPVSASTAGV
ncbi:hypothetical protein B0F90DRAFT_1808678 [Multifurca ochricompacta]|uniref:Arrestin C-terminal-like domain-containing protein n=1 Tax=Multifurca ochricompacta TaxID=376703 RepID=A0AAD4M7R1_9AGAM|nr:hypothetical protein B0F90DRAFT_1808678 [Multifurca ochricompacta]